MAEPVFFGESAEVTGGVLRPIIGSYDLGDAVFVEDGFQVVDDGL